MRRLWYSILLLSLLFNLSACAGGKTTITRTDPITKEVVIEEREASFWKSENQEMAYGYEEKGVSANEKIAIAKFEQIERNAIRRSQMNLSSEARAYADALDMVIIAEVKTALPASGMPLPKNMADVMEKNIVPLLYGGISLAGAIWDWDIGGPFGSSTNKGDGSSYLRDVTVGGDLYLNSEMNGQYTLSDQASWSMTPTTDMSTTTNTYTGNNQVGGDGSPTSSTADSDESTLW